MKLLKKVLFFGVNWITLISFMSFPVCADVQVASVEHGNATVVYENNTYNITASDGAIVNYSHLGSTQGETIRFIQPGLNSNMLNRVIGPDPSIFSGSMFANGQILIVNPMGIYFAPTAQVNVAGGLIASTLGISNADFLAGTYALARDPSMAGHAVVNAGNIVTGPGGFVALIGGSVSNQGTIRADGGSVVLAAADKATLALDGDGLLSVVIDKPIQSAIFDLEGHKVNDAISNKGVIEAAGGRVIVSAKAAEEVFDNVINHEGMISAKSVSVVNGEIILSGGEEGVVRVSGGLDASGKNAGEKGGTVQVLGDKVGLFDGASVDVSGTEGGGTALIGGDYKGQGPVQAANAAYVDAGASVHADAIREGKGGKIIVWAKDSTRAYGTVTAKGGSLSGDGGLIETSGKNFLDVANIKLDAGAPNGAGGVWLLDPRNLTIGDVATGGGSFSGGTPDVFTPTADDATVLASDINSRLNSGTSVTINTGSTGSQDGWILLDTPVLAAINKTAGGDATLTLTAASYIHLYNTISATVGKLNVSMTSNYNTDANDGILVAGQITTHGGYLSLTTKGSVILPDSGGADPGITTGGGALTILADSDGDDVGEYIHLMGDVATGGGTVSITGADFTLSGGTLNSGSGNITLQPSRNAATIGIQDSAKDFTVTEAELQAITSTGRVTIGNSSNTGGITVGTDGTLDLTGTTYNMALTSGNALSINFSNSDFSGINLADNKTLTLNTGAVTGGRGYSDITISGVSGALVLNTSGAVGTLINPINTTIERLSGTSGGALYLDNLDNSLTVNSALTASGTVSIRAGMGTFTNTGTIAAGANALTITADTMSVNADITANGGITVRPDSDLSKGLNDSSGDFNLTAAELGHLKTTGTLTIGASGDSSDVYIGGSGATNLGGGSYNFVLYGGAVNFQNQLTLPSGKTATFNTGAITTTSPGSDIVIGGTGTLIFNTTGDVGESGNELSTNVAQLGASTIGGGLYLDNGNNALTVTGAVTTAASNGEVWISSGTNTLTINAGGGLASGDGAMTVLADNMALGGTITTGAGLVTLRPFTASRAIDIGTNTAGKLGLTEAELNTITTHGGLTIGSDTGTGDITVSAAANLTGISGGTLTLQNSGAGNININNTLTSLADTALTTEKNITFGASGAITAAGKTVTLTTTGGGVEGNAAALTNVTANTLIVASTSGIGNSASLETAVSTLSLTNDDAAKNTVVVNTKAGGLSVSGSNNGTGTFNIEEKSGNLIVGAPGITTYGGRVLLKADGAGKTIGSAAGGDISTSDGNVDMIGDLLSIAGDITAGAGTITLKPVTAGRTIGIYDNAGDFKGDATTISGTLSASTLNIGDSNSGAIYLGGQGPVDFSSGGFNLTLNGGALTLNHRLTLANDTTLTLNTGAVTSSPDATDVNIGGTGSIVLNTTGSVGTLVAPLTTAVANLSGTSGGALYLDNGNNSLAVDDTLTANGTVAISAGTGTFENSGTISASGSNALTITADTVEINAGITANGGITVKPATQTRSKGINDSTGDFNLTDIGIGYLSTTGTLTIGAPGDSGAVYINDFGALDLGANHYDWVLYGGHVNFRDQLTLPSGKTATFNTGAITTTSPDMDIVIGGAGTLILNTTGSVGASGDELATNIARLGASTVGGDLYLSNGDNALTVTGALNTSGTTQLSTGTNTFANTGTITVGGSNTLTIIGDSLTLGNTITANGGITLQPVTDTSSIGLAGGAGSFNLTAAELGYLSSTGPITIGASGGSGVLSLGADLNMAGKILNIYSGQINDTTHSFIADTLNLYLNSTDTNTVKTNVTTLSADTTAGSSQDLTVTEANGLILGASNLGSGNLDVTVTTGNLSDSGTVTVGGTGSFRTLGSNATINLDTLAVTGPVTVNTTGANADASVTNASELVLDTSSVGGNLTAVATTGNLSDSGTLTAGGSGSFMTSANNATINLDTLAVTGPLSLHTTGANADASIVNATGIDFGASSIGRDLSATATTGNITDSGALAVGRNAALTTSQANSGITLDSGFSILGTLGLNTNGASGNASVTSVSAVNLGASTVGGTLGVNSGNNALTVSGAVTSGGTTTLSAGTNTFSNTGTISVGGANTLTITGDSVVLGNTITANGGITLKPGKTTTTIGLVGGAGLFNLDSTELGYLSTTGPMTIGASGGSGDLSLGADLNMAGKILNIHSGQINDSTHAFIANTLNLYLNSAGANTIKTNVTTLTADTTAGSNQDLTVTEANGLILGASDLGSGNLNVTVTAGDLSDSGTVTVGGASSFTTSANNAIINLDTLAATGPVALNTTGTSANASVTNTIGLILDTSSVGGNLTAIATTGNMSDSGTVTVGGTGSFRTLANNATVNLDTLAVTGPVTLNTTGASADAGVTNAAGLILNTSSVGGNLTAVATTGNLSDSGTVTVGGSGSFATSANNATINLDTLAVTGPVALNTTGASANAGVTNAAGLTLGASSVGGNLSAVATTGNLSDSGTVTAGGSGSFTTSANNATINLDTLAVTGPVSLHTTGANADASIVNATGIDFGASSIGRDLGATATTGNITDSGVLAVGRNAVLTTSQANSGITLDSGFSILGTLGLNTNGASGNASVTSVSAVNLGASAVGGTLGVNSGNNALTVSGAVTSGGATTLNAGTNTFSNTGTISVGGSNVLTITGDSVALGNTITANGGITLKPSTQTRTKGLNDSTGDFNLTSAELGYLTSTGTVTIGASGDSGAMYIGNLGAVNLGAGSYHSVLYGGAVNFRDQLTLPSGKTVTFNTGAITTTSPGNDIVIGGAGTLILNTSGSVGASGSDLTTNVAQLGASTVGGSLYLDNGNNALTVTGALNTSGTTRLSVGTNTFANTGTMTVGGSNALTIIGDSLALGNTITANGGITLQPLTAARTIGLNDASGLFNLNSTELGYLTSTGSVTIGASGGSGALSIGSLGAIGLGAKTYDLTLNAGATTFSNNLTAPGGKTLTLNTAGITGSGGTDITIGGAGTLVLNASGAVGTSVNKLETAISKLGASTVAGNLYLFNNGGLTISGALLTTAGTALDIRAASPITVNAPVSNSSGADILLAALGSTASDNLTINGNITASGGSGNIDLYAGNNVTIANGVKINAAGAGNVTARAGEDYTDETINQDGNADADLTMGATSEIKSGQGDITLDATDSVTVAVANANGDSGTSRGDVTVTARGIGSHADRGKIIDANGADLNITGDTVDLSAYGDIGAANDYLEVDYNFLNATSTTGTAYIIHDTGKTIDTSTTTGGITFTRTGDVIVKRAEAPNGPVSLTTTAGGSITSDTSEIVIIGYGSITLRSAGMIGSAAIPLHFFVTGCTIYLSADKQVDNLSINLLGNASRFEIEFLNTPPGLVLYNRIVMGGAPVPSLEASFSGLYVDPLPVNHSEYGEMDTRYGDFPGLFNLNPWLTADYAPSVDESALAFKLDPDQYGLSAAKTAGV